MERLEPRLLLSADTVIEYNGTLGDLPDDPSTPYDTAAPYYASMNAARHYTHNDPNFQNVSGFTDGDYNADHNRFATDYGEALTNAVFEWIIDTDPAVDSMATSEQYQGFTIQGNRILDIGVG